MADIIIVIIAAALVITFIVHSFKKAKGKSCCGQCGSCKSCGKKHGQA